MVIHLHGHEGFVFRLYRIVNSRLLITHDSSCSNGVSALPNAMRNDADREQHFSSLKAYSA